MRRFAKLFASVFLPKQKSSLAKAVSLRWTALLEALRARTGRTVRPIVGRLQVIIDNDFVGVDGSAVVSGLSEATVVFTDAVSEHVDATVSAIESEHRERHRELAGRLRNDARVKTALRRRIQLTASGLE